LQSPDRYLICALEGALLKTNLRSERLIQGAKNNLDKVLSSQHDLERLQLENVEKNGNPLSIPLNEKVVAFLQEEKASGRQLLLDTTEPKAQIERQRAGKSYLAGKNVPSGVSFERHFQTPSAGFATTFRAVRAHQWLKNLLVFVPIITSQQFMAPGALINTIIMFLCFSAVASFGYIVNDLLDLQSDRIHQSKKHRPFASGKLSISQGFIIGAVLLVLAAVG